MQRRDFIIYSGIAIAGATTTAPFSLSHSSGEAFPKRPNRDCWTHGSPYLGHSDQRPGFRGLKPEQIRHELIHFHTAEPWRKTLLFRL